jgi:hypothetical protein
MSETTTEVTETEVTETEVTETEDAVYQFAKPSISDHYAAWGRVERTMRNATKSGKTVLRTIARELAKDPFLTVEQIVGEIIQYQAATTLMKENRNRFCENHEEFCKKTGSQMDEVLFKRFFKGQRAEDVHDQFVHPTVGVNEAWKMLIKS